MSNYNDVVKVLTEKFGGDNFISLTTTDGERVFTRVVNACYDDGAFYIVTYALSNKMKQIEKNPVVAIFCGEWFGAYINAHGVGENLGHVLAEENTVMMAKLREAFSMWYTGGHVNENDPNTCLLRIRLTDALLSVDFEQQKINFVNKMA